MTDTKAGEAKTPAYDPTGQPRLRSMAWSIAWLGLTIAPRRRQMSSVKAWAKVGAWRCRACSKVGCIAVAKRITAWLRGSGRDQGLKRTTKVKLLLLFKPKRPAVLTSASKVMP